MTTTAEQMRAWTGPTILSFGFRPFFLLAGIWAALAMGLWIMMLSGKDILPTAFDPVSWHAHEFLFGYLGAVLAGFLLTAVPNWTGRLPIVGWPLAGLVALWLAGRAAVAVSDPAPALAMLVDLAFGLALALVIGREIIAGRNWHNLPVLGLISVFILANALFHLETLRGGYAAGSAALRLGLAGAVMLISLIGGRIIPSFTRNWLVQQGSPARPVPFATADKLVLGLSLVALALWVPWPDHAATGAACAVAGLAHLWRLSRWSGRHTGTEPLVWVLHVGYSFVPLGFLLLGAASFGLLPRAAAQHMWMAGAIGLMTLAVMTRASLGHAGRPLRATPAITALYLVLIASVLARLGYGLWPGATWLAYLAATLWIAAFAGFAGVYWPILARPRLARKRVS
ncbi:MAG: NnrS family protein [Pseudorhodobacter sp.]|nr:NnrS family protein [Pseudorhodobacter sp.]